MCNYFRLKIIKNRDPTRVLNYTFKLKIYGDIVNHIDYHLTDQLLVSLSNLNRVTRWSQEPSLVVKRTWNLQTLKLFLSTQGKGSSSWLNWLGERYALASVLKESKIKSFVKIYLMSYQTYFRIVNRKRFILFHKLWRLTLWYMDQTHAHAI